MSILIRLHSWSAAPRACVVVAVDSLACCAHVRARFRGQVTSTSASGWVGRVGGSSGDEPMSDQPTSRFPGSGTGVSCRDLLKHPSTDEWNDARCQR